MILCKPVPKSINLEVTNTRMREGALSSRLGQSKSNVQVKMLYTNRHVVQLHPLYREGLFGSGRATNIRTCRKSSPRLWSRTKYMQHHERLPARTSSLPPAREQCGGMWATLFSFLLFVPLLANPVPSTRPHATCSPLPPPASSRPRPPFPSVISKTNVVPTTRYSSRWREKPMCWNRLPFQLKDPGQPCIGSCASEIRRVR